MHFSGNGCTTWIKTLRYLPDTASGSASKSQSSLWSIFSSTIFLEYDRQQCDIPRESFLSWQFSEQIWITGIMPRSCYLPPVYRRQKDNSQAASEAIDSVISGVLHDNCNIKY